MKRTLFSLTLSLWIVAMVATSAMAGLNPSNYHGNVEKVKSDSLTWSQKAQWVYTDTLAAGTVNDTTISYDIAGAKYIALQVTSQSMKDDSDYTIYPEVSSDNGTYWIPLATTLSVDNTAGSQVGGSDGLAWNKVLCVLKYPVVGDTLVTAGGALSAGDSVDLQRYHTTHGDNLIMGAMRWIRFRIDPDASSGDTTLVSGVITRIF